MRTVTVDTRGLWFTLKLALIFSLAGAGWSAWGPFADETEAHAENVSTALATVLSEEEAEPEPKKRQSKKPEVPATGDAKDKLANVMKAWE